MAEWCQKCGTYHDVTTAGGCPDKEDKLWVGTYAEGFRAGQEAAEIRVAALEAENGRLREAGRALLVVMGWSKPSPRRPGSAGRALNPCLKRR